MVITDDHGGRIFDYLSRVNEARAAHEHIIVDGECSSACILYLTLPSCATPRAKLFFHSAHSPDGEISVEGSNLYLSLLPWKIQEAVRRRGGLTPVGWWIKGREAQALIGACHD
jgi:hypothetical protein